MGQKLQQEGGAGFVPDTVVVAGDDPEPIISRANIIIMGRAACPGIVPSGIDRFHHIFKAVLFRSLKAKGSVLDLDLASTWRDLEGYRSRGRAGLAALQRANPLALCGAFVGDDLLDNDGGRLLVGFDSGLDGYHTANGGEPDASVFAFPTGRLGHTIALNAHQTIRFPKRGGAHYFDGPSIQGFEILLADPENPRAAAHPKIAEIVFHNLVDFIAE